jgi:hypothetical protein
MKTKKQNNTLKKAISDARTVVDAAQETAKSYLMESFAPSFKKILEEKMYEEDEIPSRVEDEEEEDNLDRGEHRFPEEEAVGHDNLDDLDRLDNLDDVDEELPPHDMKTHGEEGEDDYSDLDSEIEEILREIESDGYDKDEDEDEKEKFQEGEEEVDEGEEPKVSGRPDTKAAPFQLPPKYNPEQHGAGTEGRKASVAEGVDMEESTVEEIVKENISLKKAFRNLQKELSESKRAIVALNEAVKDVDLLNKKLAYAGKLVFKNPRLSEKQRMSIYENLDRATNSKEAKLIYAILKEHLNRGTQTPLSKASASKTVKRIVTESRDSSGKLITENFDKRMQELAGVL